MAINIRQILLVSLVLIALAFTGQPAFAIESQPNTADANTYTDEIANIMERCTVSRWGKDCFVWVLHYADDMIDPWVEAEAVRNSMSDSDKNAYRAQFVSDLQLDTSETFLINIFSFGAAPVELTPVPDNITLLSASGARLRPKRYDSRFDSPVSGLAQGLIFFPKQDNQNFALSIRGLGMSGNIERIFAFNGNAQYYEPAAGEPVSGSDSGSNFDPEPEPEVIVVTLPKRQRESGSKVKVIEPPDEFTPPLVPVTPREIPPLFADENVNPESSDMAAFVRSVRDSNNNNIAAGAAGETGQSNQENSYVSRESVLREFLTHWINNRSDIMYDMLDSASQKNISRENFSREIARATDLRAGMREGYTIEWIGEEKARVICYQRFLMFRSLLTRNFGITRENSSWRIIW